MANKKGHIKLNRGFFQNFLWSETRTFSKAEAWIDLIQSARFEASTESINGKVIELQRGELAASRRFLELRWNWGSSKVSNFLKTLTDLGMINQRQANGQTIILLVKYNVYNDKQTNNEPQTKPMANQRQTTNKPTANQNKEYKEEKEIKGTETEGENDFVVFEGLKFLKSHIIHSEKFVKDKISAETFMQQNKIAEIKQLKSYLIEFLKHLNVEGKSYNRTAFKDFRRHFLNWFRKVAENETKYVKSIKNGVPADWLS